MVCLSRIKCQFEKKKSSVLSASVFSMDIWCGGTKYIPVYILATKIVYYFMIFGLKWN